MSGCPIKDNIYKKKIQICLYRNDIILYKFNGCKMDRIGKWFFFLSNYKILFKKN